MLQINFNIGALTEWLRGKKTYIMILVGAVDQIGALQGWWESDKLREIVEAALGLAAARAGMGK